MPAEFSPGIAHVMPSEIFIKIPPAIPSGIMAGVTFIIHDGIHPALPTPYSLFL